MTSSPATDRAPIVISGSLRVEGLHCAIRSTEGLRPHHASDHPLRSRNPRSAARDVHPRNHFPRADSRRYLPGSTWSQQDESTRWPVPTTVVEWDQGARQWLQPAVKLVITR